VNLGARPKLWPKVKAATLYFEGNSLLTNDDDEDEDGGRHGPRLNQHHDHKLEKGLDRKRRKMNHGGRAIPTTEHHGSCRANGVTVKDV
jgi:hypothetical protein